MDRKRALDLALLLPTLPLFLPLIGGLSLLVRAVDGGPVYFVQERVGRGGRTIRVHKLRTMGTEADPALRRPTRLGAWLRHRGLDELPQLLDVLRGDMSLVGPRPLTRADLDRLVATVPAFEERLQVPPGLTGLAQVCQSVGLEQTARLEQAYALRRSAVLDLRILAGTAVMNLVGKSRGRWDPGRAGPSLSPQ